MDETRDKLVGGTREELKEARDELEAPQGDELELNNARNPTTLPVYDDGGKDPSPLPCFALAAKAEGGMINGDAPALARGVGEGSPDTCPAAEGEALFREGLTLLDCVLEGAFRCLSLCAGEGEGDAFLDLECC